MPNWASATVTANDGAMWGSTERGDQVQVTTRPGVGSVRVAQAGVTLIEKTGVVSESRGARSREIVFDDGSVWTVTRLRSGCGCGGGR